MITVNDVKNGVVSILVQNFPPPAYAVYGEEIKQGFEEPCFFVKFLSGSQDRELGRRHKRHHSFDIHYFPESKTGANEEIANIIELLYGLLEYVRAGGSLFRGRGMNHETVNGVLHFFVNYDFHVMRPAPEQPRMLNLEQEGYIRD